jgi:cysteinyl-tRNA synthetase
MESFLDDLNTPKVIAKLNEEANDALSASDERKKEIKNNLLSAGKILGILEDDPGNWLGYNQKDTKNAEEIERLINERNEARRSKNFNLADTIRDTLKDKGIEIEDTDKGTIWRKSR